MTVWNMRRLLSAHYLVTNTSWTDLEAFLPQKNIEALVPLATPTSEMKGNKPVHKVSGSGYEPLLLLAKPLTPLLSTVPNITFQPYPSTPATPPHPSSTASHPVSCPSIPHTHPPKQKSIGRLTKARRLCSIRDTDLT